MKLLGAIFLKSSLVLMGLAITLQSNVYSQESDRYVVTNLVSNLPGTAPNTDPNLINPWGLTFDSLGDLIVANNGTSLGTAYKSNGFVIGFIFDILTTPTGAERNLSKADFIITQGTNTGPAHFLFATEAGTILGYNRTVDLTNAIVVIDRSVEGAIYKGLTIATIGDEPYIFAANFGTSEIDVFDRNFAYVRSFNDSTIPNGFAPFNIREIEDRLVVTYALKAGADDVPGLGNGYVNVFSTDGVLIKRLISEGHLNSPWGLTLAPKHFGKFSGALLVGNFGDGHINAYRPLDGSFLGQLLDTTGTPLAIDGLWSIKFKPKGEEDHIPDLYFTSGGDAETLGLLGTISPSQSVE